MIKKPLLLGLALTSQVAVADIAVIVNAQMALQWTKIPLKSCF